MAPPGVSTCISYSLGADFLPRTTGDRSWVPGSLSSALQRPSRSGVAQGDRIIERNGGEKVIKSGKVKKLSFTVLQKGLLSAAKKRQRTIGYIENGSEQWFHDKIPSYPMFPKSSWIKKICLHLCCHFFIIDATWINTAHWQNPTKQKPI